MRNILYTFLWIAVGSLVAVLDIMLQGTGSIVLSAPQLIIAFWAPLMVTHDDPTLILKALLGFFIIDFYTVTPFGFYSLSLLGGLYITRVLFQRVFSSVSLITILAGSVFCALVTRLILYMFLGLFLLLHKGFFPVNLSALAFSVEEALATSILSVPVYFMCRGLYGRVRRPEGNFVTI